ncbi:UNVERIFIED_CONTAM: hypothetical protein GTU68_052305, partial [Idotea baltica]|nr:hypothetical protein [Idotea baltica]
DRDVIGLAETGSGKTGAFALPILQSLILHPRKPFALILSPTRELAIQIKEQFEALGRDIGLSCCAVVGGMDMDLQSRELSKHPHIIVATPGRLVNHIFKTKSLRLDKIEYLVMDEADRILALGFGNDLDKIISEVPCVRRTMLFSATMTNKIKKLQRAHLRNPVKVEVSSKFQTVNKLQQKMIFMAFDLKTVYLIYLLKQIGSESVILLCSTCNTTLRIALLLRSFGFSAIPIHSKMSQSKRMSAITKFKTKDRSILVGTDVISR